MCTWDKVTLMCEPLPCLNKSTSHLFISSTTPRNFLPVDMRIYLISQSNAWYYRYCHNTLRKKVCAFPFSLSSWVIPLKVKKKTWKDKTTYKACSRAKSWYSLGWQLPLLDTLHLKIELFCSWVYLSWPPVLVCGLSWIIHRTLLEISPCLLVLQ